MDREWVLDTPVALIKNEPAPAKIMTKTIHCFFFDENGRFIEGYYLEVCSQMNLSIVAKLYQLSPRLAALVG
jgi:hypothetical protein